MAETSSSFVELQEVGTVALIGVALVPGVIWVSKAPTGFRMAARMALVAGVIVGIIALESRMDQTANKITEAL